MLLLDTENKNTANGANKIARMKISVARRRILMRRKQCILFLTAASALVAANADETTVRLAKAATVYRTISDSGRGIKAEQLANSDCIAVIPGFKKGAAVVGVGYGRGFISYRTASGWSAPGAISLESGSLGVQIGGEEMDVVILSLDKERRSKLLSDRFTIGSDASASWGNGKSVHDNPNVKVVFYGHTKGAFAGFGLDGATLKPDESGNKALYGRPMTNTEIVGSEVAAPAAAESLIGELLR